EIRMTNECPMTERPNEGKAGCLLTTQSQGRPSPIRHSDFVIRALSGHERFRLPRPFALAQPIHHVLERAAEHVRRLADAEEVVTLRPELLTVADVPHRLARGVGGGLDRRQ